MKQKLVAVEDVTLQTVAVEIKALTIGKKQMTLSVFRQLSTEPLLELVGEQLQYRGLMWGRVDYHWTGCAPATLDTCHPHVHVVWQSDTRLLQTPVYEPVALNVQRFEAGGTVWRDCSAKFRDGRVRMPTDEEVKRFVTATPHYRHPMYATCFDEVAALDQLFIAV